MKKIFVLFAVFAILFQAGCASGGEATTQAPAPANDSGDQVATGIALTLAAQSSAATPANTDVPLEVQPTATLEQPTLTAVPSVEGTLNYGANCRKGPGANFLNVVVYSKGSLVQIIGTSKDTSGAVWWLVSSSGQADCWLIDAALAISGDKSSVAKVVSPPTPTPVPPPTWDGTWKIWMGQTGLETITTMTFVQSGNQLTSRFYAFDTGFNFTGTVSADGMTVNATITPDSFPIGFPAVFKRNPSNLNQFAGSYNWPGVTEFDAPWCGAKNNANKPDPCKSH